MKVLQIIDSLGTGGAEKLIVETVPQMVEHGLIVDVLLLNGKRTSFYENLEKSKTCNIYSLGKSFYNPLYIFKIISYLKNYDIVHVHLFPAQYFAIFAKILSWSNVKLVFTEHSTDNKRINNSKLKRIEQWIYSHYHKIVCITDEVKNSLKTKLDLPDDKLIIVNNGINLREIEKSKTIDRNKYGFTATDKILIMVAAFRAEKDQDTVIKAMAKLPSYYKLILVGDGIRRDELQNLVNSLGVEKTVHFLGFQSDVLSLIKMSDVAILSSHWEGFGLAALECMACGIPTIASNVPGLADIVRGGGILFEKTNVAGLQKQILSLENDLTYRSTKEKGVLKAKQYDISIMIDKLIDLYYSICKK